MESLVLIFTDALYGEGAGSDAEDREARRNVITVVIFYWRILLISESMGHHDSEIMDDRSID